MSLNITMKEMDVVGCGYERVASAGTPFEDTDKGKVYFTYNGTRLCESLDGIEAGLWPALHIQQKVRLVDDTLLGLAAKGCVALGFAKNDKNCVKFA